MEIGIIFRSLVRRAWLVVLLGAIGATGAWLAVGSEAATYRTHVSFMLQPDAQLAREAVPDAVDALKQEGPLVQNASGLIEADALATLSRISGSSPDDMPRYSVFVSARPGSSIFDVELEGPDRAIVQSATASLSDSAPREIGSTFHAYELAQLQPDGDPQAVLPDTRLAGILGLTLGVLLGIACVLVETWRRVSREAEAGETERATSGAPREARPLGSLAE